MSTDGRTSIHVYNARCALTVEPARNRRGDIHTANLETASRAAAVGDFRWAEKLVVQVTGTELPDVLAVLLGHLPAVEFLYHGPRRDKGYRLFHDGERLIVQLFSGRGERFSVSLSAADRLALSALLFRQLQRNHGGIAAEVLYAMITDIYRGADDAAPSRSTSGGDELGATSAPSVDDRATPKNDPYDW